MWEVFGSQQTSDSVAVLELVSLEGLVEFSQVNSKIMSVGGSHVGFQMNHQIQMVSLVSEEGRLPVVSLRALL